MITALRSNEIFVFGSNTAGRHGKGAALQAMKEFGAQYGVGEGLTGQCYAFPTLDDDLDQVDEQDLELSIINLIDTAERYPDKVFLLTKVGCGLAGFDESYMLDLFMHFDLPSNIIKPEGW